MNSKKVMMVHYAVMTHLPMMDTYLLGSLALFNQSHISLTSLLTKLYVSFGMYTLPPLAISSNSLQEHYKAKSFLFLMSFLFILFVEYIVKHIFFNIHYIQNMSNQQGCNILIQPIAGPNHVLNLSSYSLDY